jgi:hypothetical protein
MKTDIDRIAFAGAATGTVVATIDADDVEQLSVGVAESALGGVVTNHGYDVYLYNGTDSFDDGDVFGSEDLLAAAKQVIFSRFGAAGAAKATVAPNGPAFPGPAKTLKVKIWVTGAGGNLTGEIVIVKKRI